jgi:hypothetical protein
MLTSSTRASKHSNSSELQRFTRLEEAKHRERLTDSAIKIQSNFRRFFAIKTLKRLKKEKEFQVQTKSAIKIQAFFRGFFYRQRVKFLKLSRNIFKIRDQAARIIQKRCRFASFKAKLKVLALAARVKRVRSSAAKVIQKRIRGFLVRKDLFFFRSGKISMLVCWRYPARSVFICGNFTFPPWKVEIPLVFSKYLNGFCSGFFIENRLEEGDYFLKFIVDGSWLCDGKYPLSQDSEGNYNNVVKVISAKPRLGFSASARELNVDKKIMKLPRNDFKKIVPFERLKYLNPVFLNHDSNTDVQLAFNYSFQNYEKVFTFFNENLNFFSMFQKFRDFFSIGKDSERFLRVLNVLKKNEKFLGKIKERGSESERVLQEFKESFEKIKKILNFQSLFLGVSLKNLLIFLNFGTFRLLLFRKRVKTGQYLHVFTSGITIESNKKFKSENQEKPQLEACESILSSSNSHYFKEVIESDFESNFEMHSKNIELELIELQPDDVILLVTDGILTGVSLDEIGLTLQRLSMKGFTSEYFCERVAIDLARQSRDAGKNNWKRMMGKKNETFKDLAFEVFVGLACRGES